MNTKLMNSKNSKTFGSHRLILNLSNEINLKRSDKNIAISNLSIYHARKNIKTYENNKFKYSLRHVMINLNYLMNNIPYQILKTILIITSKSIKP